MATLVSVAGGADLGVEIDLHTLSQDIEAEVVEYEPESYPALYLRFEEDGATVMLFSSGKYNIAGASSIKELYETHQRLVETISSMLDVEIEAEDECDLRNLVYTDDFGSNLRLEKLVLLFGMENSEYEPEQFPALDYRPPDTGGLFKIFRTGKITLTGVTDPDVAEEAFESLFDTLDEAIESV
mgnify:CR=1 FL=1